MANKKFLKLVIAIAVSEAAGVIGSVFTTPSIPTWYATLAKPALNPPAWVFGPVWTTLFALMGISVWLIWSSYVKSSEDKKKLIRIALVLFGVQLVLNIFWSVIFFGLHSPGGAFIEIVFLWLAILAAIIAFSKISRAAAWLLAPYILWVSFAGYLNYSIWQLSAKESGQAACTMEAKLCPDGSSVGRAGPKCEFAECPSENNKTSSGFGNDQIEKAVTDYLLTQKHFSWKTNNDSHNFCAIENLNPESELFPLYVWVYCGEYIVQDGELKTLSGSSGPAKINYPNELSFYDLNKFSYEAPGDGSRYSEDIKKIFPENVQQRIFNFSEENIIKKMKMN